MVAGDTNGYPDIFLYDQQTDNTERVNLNSSGEQAKDWGSSGVAISATGRYVVFGSGASNLVPGDTYGTSDVFVRDRQTGTTRIISINGDGQIGNDSSSSPKITGDGRYIAFLSEADNLVPDDVNDRRDAFIHDIQTGITEIVSVSSTGEQANRNIYGPTTLTEDGRYVTFMSQATNLVPDDTKSLYDVFVYDRMTKTIERVSVNSVGQQGNHATGFFGLDISADGRFVVFDSAATNFTDGDTNNVYDIFLRDRGVRPFLDLPVSYSNFAQTAQGNVSGNGGRVNSWFDHNLPNYSTNNDLYRWNGPYAGAASVNRDHCIIDQQSCYDGHNGIDFQHQIHMPNEPIYAAASGTVTTTNITGYGNQVVIDHHNGYATLYGHLKTIGVTVGTTVTVGQPIGIMGNTGISIGGDGTHLHFGVYYDQNADGWTSNEVVDPYGWIGPGNDPCRATNPASCGPQQYLWKYPLQAKQMADSDGGIITSLSGNTSIAVQAGTLTSTINLELWDTPPVAAPSAQLRSVGHSFLFQVFEWLSASSVNRAQSTTATSFAQPVTVTVSYSDTATLHLDESRLGIYRWDEINNLWMALTTTVNLTENQAVAQTVEIGNFDLQAPLLCLADSLEPNDNYYAASAISAYPVAVSSLFDGVQDEDWFRFNAAAGRQYVVQTDNLAGGVDTAIAIYDLDGLTELASDDNSSDDMASRLEWQAPLDGTYFVRVFQSSTSLSGCTATYRLGIVQLQQISLPLILR